MGENEVDMMSEKAGYAGTAVILPFEKTGEYYIEQLGLVTGKPVYSFMKRTFDIVASAVALLILFIPLLMIALVVCLTSEGGAFFAQERLGKDGKPFIMIKFRTMRKDAERNGAQWSRGDNDERITKVGAFLRKVRLDELPQLWCILRGDMSFVGPRPERKVFYDEFETYIHGFSERLKVKPGLTGLAQVNGGYYLRPEEKVLYDVEYIKTRSLWLDIKILFKTVGVIFSGGGLLLTLSSSKEHMSGRTPWRVVEVEMA